MKERIYICHTFYHVYVACLKELTLPEGLRGQATLLLSSMSCDFGDLRERALTSGIFEDVLPFEEKEGSYFPELAALHQDSGNLLRNMISRIRYTKGLGRLEEPFVPVDLREYGDIYVFCDSDPIGYYLNWKRLRYHALEDGLDCIRYFDTARYDNRGHFALKAWMASKNLIFIQNGYSKYCIDMEVNDLASLQYPAPKMIERPREELVRRLSREGRERILRLFVKDPQALLDQIGNTEGRERVLILTEPLCQLPVRERIFRDIVETYGKGAYVVIKPHPRDLLDYGRVFPGLTVLDRQFPMEALNFLGAQAFDRAVSVFTVMDSLHCAREKIFLDADFMDRYEDPAVHRQNELI